MPYTRKQVRVAQAVEHGWRAKGSAKGFTKSFAADVVVETDNGHKKSMMRKPANMAAMRKHRAEMMLGKGAHAASKGR